MIDKNTTSQDRFAIVQDVYQSENWQIAATLLSDILGLRPMDAKQQARKSRGFLAANLSSELAQRFRDACMAREIRVHVVPQSEVVPIVKPVRMHQLWLTDDALLVRATDLNAKITLGWDTLRLIAVTKATKKETFHHWETDTPHARSETNLKVTAYTQNFAEYLADLFAFTAQGQIVGVRLVSRELNYAEALGELAPDAVIDANAQNDGFRKLIAAILARAKHVLISPESEALLAKPAKDSVRTVVPDSSDEFDAHNRWLLQTLRSQGSDRVGAGLR